MYLHIGNDVVVRNKNIIGIFDIENTSTGQITKDFLNANNKKIITVNYEMPKSFIVCKDAIYITPISVTTLKKRFLNFNYL